MSAKICYAKCMTFYRVHITFQYDIWSKKLTLQRYASHSSFEKQRRFSQLSVLQCCINHFPLIPFLSLLSETYFCFRYAGIISSHYLELLPFNWWTWASSLLKSVFSWLLFNTRTETEMKHSIQMHIKTTNCGIRRILYWIKAIHTVPLPVHQGASQLLQRR